MSNLECTEQLRSESEASAEPTQSFLIQMENLDSIKTDSVSVHTANDSLYMCRICHLEARTRNTFIRPCNCSGTISNVHETCLQKWVTLKNKKACELCKCEFKIVKRQCTNGRLEDLT